MGLERDFWRGEGRRGKGESKRLNVILENMEQFKEEIRTVNVRKRFHIETPETRRKKKKSTQQNKAK